MKRSKLFVVSFFFILSIFSSCKKEQIGNVKIKFKNTSAFELKNIKVQDRSVGNLKPGEVSNWIRFEHFAFDSGWPAEDIHVIKGQDLITYEYLSFCQTMHEIVTKGKYELQIDCRANQLGKFFVEMRKYE